MRGVPALLKPSPGEYSSEQEHISSDFTKVKASSLIHMTFVLYAVQQVLLYTSCSCLQEFYRVIEIFRHL